MKKIALFLISMLAFVQVHAEVLWKGDFETGDLSQWGYVLNPQGISLSECSFEGKKSALITLTGADEFLWQGKDFLNRSELMYRPKSGSTFEGKETFFAFSFYLPKELSENKHELGYWEADKVWQQMFRFNIIGTEVSFQQSSGKDMFWKISDGAKPGVWHRVAMHIHWSVDPKKGSVEVWLDGKPQGKNTFQTLPQDHVEMFTQIGILRNKEETVESILIDGALETDSLAELLEINKQNIGKTCSPQ